VRTELMPPSRVEFGIDSEARDAELGFWLLPRARGRGAAARAIRLTVSWAFDELGLERVHGLTDIDNGAAQRVMEKAGFVRGGVLRGLERRPTGRLDFVSYSMLHTDEVKLEPSSAGRAHAPRSLFRQGR
jgi:[ribosomal protein S5]-alanine N-acetyltransferase